MRYPISIVFGPILLVAGCDFPAPTVTSFYQGNGTIKQEVRPAGPFHGLDVGGSIEAEVSVGSEPKVTLSGDENLLALIGTEVRGGVLYARPVTNVTLKATSALRLTVVVPNLDHLAVLDAGRAVARLTGSDSKTFRILAEGSGAATVRDLAASSVEVEAGGASAVTILGRSGRLKARLDGASSLAAGEAPAGVVEIEQAGASRSEVNASGSIKARLSGASRLVVLGKPGTSDVVKQGAASVESR